MQREAGKTVAQGSKIASTLVFHKLTRPGLPPTKRPFLRAKIIKNYVYLSVMLWYRTLQVSFVLFTVLNSSFFVGYSLPNTFTVYQTIAISLLAVFLATFYWLAANYILKDIFLTYYQMYWINSGVYNLNFKPFLTGLHD